MLRNTQQLLISILHRRRREAPSATQIETAHLFRAAPSPLTPFCSHRCPLSPCLTLQFFSSRLRHRSQIFRPARQTIVRAPCTSGRGRRSSPSKFPSRLPCHKRRLKSESRPENGEEVQSTAGSESRAAAAPSKLCFTLLLSKQ